MEPNSAEPEQGFVEVLRRRRAELREAMSALELALASPASADDVHWAERVHVALVELAADFREHVAITEGSAGLYHELLQTVPRLSSAVGRLAREHAVITRLVDELVDAASPPMATQDLERVRDLGTALLGTLVRHRQRGSDLVYEAFQIDIGGET